MLDGTGERLEEWGPAGALMAPARHGRGAVTNPASRFDATVASPFDDGWGTLAADFT